jgi:bifunctional non-homologous end joining protein LigD
MTDVHSDAGLRTLAAPMLACEVRTLPGGEDWIYEFLWGGERIHAVKREDGVRLISREGQDVTDRFPRVATAVARLRSTNVILDGEVVYLNTYPAPVIRFLAEAGDEPFGGSLAFVAFDLLCDEGRDVRHFSLLCRRLLLSSIVQGTPIVLSPLIDARSAAARAASARLGFRGIVAKRAGSRYRSNVLSHDWLKTTFALSAALPSLFGRVMPVAPSVSQRPRAVTTVRARNS